MPKNYFIGIGGTGARLAESLVHLCAAGLGPQNLTLFLIDPDQGNGNLARTTSLMDAYVSARKSFEQPAGDDVVPFQTHLTVPSAPVWHIFDRRGVRLADHIGLASIKNTNPALADFAQVLFSDDEMGTALDEGFRGHPNIGATVISDVPTDADPWQTFWQDVGTAQGPGEVQVFVAGSIFGGTGAAGIPTLGSPEVLKFAQQASLGTSSKIRLAAGLVLPYFSFTPGATPPGQSQLFVTAADFPLATKAALAYYAEKDLAYDDVYLLGDSLGQNVGAFSPGNQNQTQPPPLHRAGGRARGARLLPEPSPRRQHQVLPRRPAGRPRRLDRPARLARRRRRAPAARPRQAAPHRVRHLRLRHARPTECRRSTRTSARWSTPGTPTTLRRATCSASATRTRTPASPPTASGSTPSRPTWRASWNGPPRSIRGRTAT